MNTIPYSLLAAVVSQVGCQLFKVVRESIRARKLEIWPLFTFGGFPSAHAAFSGAVTTAAALRAGFDSELFAVSLVFTVIILHDAVRVRGAVERLGVHFNRLREERGEPSLPVLQGHTLLEIVVGAAVGAGVAVVGYLWIG